MTQFLQEVHDTKTKKEGTAPDGNRQYRQNGQMGSVLSESYREETTFKKAEISRLAEQGPAVRGHHATNAGFIRWYFGSIDNTFMFYRCL